MLAYFAKRQAVIERLMKYYAAGICGLIAIFVLFHWTRWLCAKRERSKGTAETLSRPFVASSRCESSSLIWRDGH
jgi:hypothetical protein